MQVLTNIRLFRSPFTLFYISEGFIIFPNEECYKSIGVKVGDCCEISVDDKIPDAQVLKLRTSAFFLQLFVKECQNSSTYRHNVVTHLNKLSGYPLDGTAFLKLILEPPDTEIIDYAWNERLLRLVWMKVEIENAFSWLSTLGGAYSALGDYFEECAEEAGRISIRQYKLSQMLGDESLAARSCLYSALSQAQKGNLHISRNIVRNVAEFARKTHDRRLMRMCQGVWAKLKYLRSLKKNSSIKPT
ncbi:unnamed protein product [Arctia plantaginis]|uniref:Uncharacterized protein n=1 Tax=Arctia plantaginis TaxID=874455 RepID=A0A8S0YM69_ARCPL|nr:unnamed protein product [Arctia plantaginis]